MSRELAAFGGCEGKGVDGKAGPGTAKPCPAPLHSIHTGDRDVLGGGVANPWEVAHGSNCGEREETTQLREAAGVDWLTLTGPEELWKGAVRVLETLHGEGGESSAGDRWYRRGLRWVGGGRVDWEHRAGLSSCKVELPGRALAMLELGAVLTAAAELSKLGFRCSRLDAAVDFFSREGRSVGLLDDVFGGYRRGEVRRFTTVKLVEDRNLHRGLKGRSITFGNRGKSGGGVQVCCYDKGLERGELPAGRHERIEARYYTGRSEAAFARLLSSADLRRDGLGETAVVVLRALALSPLEFSEDEKKRRSGRASSEWWLFWLGNTVVERIMKVRRRVTFDGWCRWAGRAVLGPLERAGSRQGVTGLDLLGLLVECGSVVVARSRGESDAMGQARQWLTEQLGGVGRVVA